MILPKNFYNRKTLQIAQDLLGCFLVRKIGKKIIKSKIVETEAYNGPKDLASHASRRKTPRNSIMFGEPGIIYVYFTYGMHYMLNIVTEKKEYPAAVLIRAVEFAGANGPARLTKILKIDKNFNGLSIYTKKYGLWIEGRSEELKNFQIKKTTRIGVDYAGKYKDKKWRFYIRGNQFISKK
jgi:DNA-3-methyladenine glycosylase